MKVSVLGAGAIGSIFGGLVQHHDPGCEVTLVARGAHAAAIRDQGHVELHGPWGVRRPPVRVTENPADIAGSTHVLLAVKLQDARSAMEAAQPYLGDAVLTSIQNGANGSLLAEFVPAERLVLGVTVINVAAMRPGAFVLQIGGVTAVGPAAPNTGVDSASRARGVWAKSGLPVEMHPQIVGMQYNKLVVNCLGCAAAVSNLNFVREGLFDRSWRTHVAWPIYQECLAVFAAAGVELEPIAASSDATRLARLLRGLDRPLLGQVIRFGERVFVRRKPTRFSVRQDLDRRRPTEVQFINGEIVRLARVRGAAAPYNELVVQLVHELERQDGGAIPRDAVIARFRDLSPQRAALV